ncbi:MAG: hypothetical protein ACLFWM_03830 [Actinomycetota bacterium]
MLRKGQQVETLTKVVGQTPRRGKVIDVRDKEFVEVEWDDGRVSTVTAASLLPVAAKQRSRA